jgi:predicted RNA-binding Zn-ribbon protein involved in translation (DUF1610 family)
MGAELIPIMSSGSGADVTGEHFLMRVMIGEADSVRARLADAVEKMGYLLVSEQPLLARRGARGWAESWLSNNILEYPTKLTIGLKPAGAGATRVTFDYEVKHPMMSGGDKQTLTREAEAIIALAAARATPSACPACGAQMMADSRFCRQCGAPMATAAPAELEVLRVTAGARAGYQQVILGAILLAATCLIPLLIFLGDSENAVKYAKIVKVVTVLSLLTGGLGWTGLLIGLRRLHLTLNPKQAGEELSARQILTAPRTGALPAQPARASVTEGTTELLPAEQARSTAPTPQNREPAV